MHKEYSAAIEISQTDIPVQVEIKDYYPEGADGVRKFYVAIYMQPFYEEYSSVDLREPLKNLKEALKRNLQGSWQWGSYVYSAPIDADFNTLEEFFKVVDSQTDADDRIFLIISGHGAIDSDGRYYYVLGDGTKVGDLALMGLLRTLGPALDFVIFFTCYSYNFNYGQNLNVINDTALGYEIWLHESEGYTSEFEDQISKIVEELDNGVTNARVIFKNSMDTTWWRYNYFGLPSHDPDPDIYVPYGDFELSEYVESSQSGEAIYGIIYIPASGFVITPF